MQEHSLLTTGGRLVNAGLAARMLGLKPDTLRVYSLRYAVGSKLAGQWWYTSEDLDKIAARKGQRRGKAATPAG